MKTKNFDIHNPDWKKELPIPVFDEKPEYLDFYFRAWELARDHVKEIPGMPQTPYMDEAFMETDIWIWDTCFMMFFCKYAANVFPGIETLNNFYKPLHDGTPLPKIIARNMPDWAGVKDGELAQVRIHIPDNPPLFAWAEYNYALMTGDKKHLEELLVETQYLQKHFAFLESLKEPGYVTEYIRSPSCLVKLEDGYLWEGGRCGMDNTPRGKTGAKAESERPNHPRMLWIDAISQQGLTAFCISKIAELLNRDELAVFWLRKYEEIKAKVNTIYWDDSDGMYYDVHNDTREFMKCLTPASFWPLVSGMPEAARVERMCSYLANPNKLGGRVPWVTLSRDDADFDADNGQYWRGALWLPAAYMGIKGLENYGRLDIANETARKILEHMYMTWKNYEPHTIWECYSPNFYKPAKHRDERVRPDFCGWSALGPISLFIENVIGIYSANAFTNTVKWALPADVKGRLGITNYTFGDTVTDIIYENGKVSTRSTLPYTLFINGKEFSIPAGNAGFSV